ncbi:hypothetical protein EV201_1014 [Ancylomarina subtilis]|uniref:PH domain-containing protein n=1 Tax=Ancylomarina subtilis TaxID=1639035 RepID=A0A4Q7VJK0_9BACT|nr:hypothetical protein [Ancylomarina subtilis]RZT96376.1 hypothetical protein EV201_1014 [Ancylomarina subtilis]
MKTLKLKTYIVLIFITSIFVSGGLLGYGIYFAITRPEDMTDARYIFASIFVLFVLGPPIFMTITYYLEEFKKSVTLYENGNKIVIKNNNEEFIINRAEILDSYHVKVDEHNGLRYKFSEFEYILIVLKGGRRVFITNFLCKPDKILTFLRLKPNMIYTNVPFINRRLGEQYLTPKEFDKKVNEFSEIFRDKKEEDLIKICKQTNVYADYAIRAARQQLRERCGNTTANKS